MNKMNKKGFTLIEMLVVIAIIAVLVSIIIPIVGNSTEKARAAADAANLRSVLATLTIKALNSEDGLAKTTTGESGANATELTKNIAGIDIPACKSDTAAKMYYTYDGETVDVFFKNSDTTHTITSLATKAGS